MVPLYSRAITSAVALVASTGIMFSLTVAGGRAGSTQEAAAQVAPPPPPTYIPTPIGAPPGPPTATPTPAPTATVTPISGDTAVASPTATKAAATVDFSLDAARVARVNNPGNFSGLTSVKPGTRVWLMMYYTVRSLPHNATRLTTYSVGSSGKTLFKVAYRTTIKSTDLGRFSRYQVFDVPATLPFGRYTFHASLSIANVAQQKRWSFRLARKEVSTRASGRP